MKNIDISRDSFDPMRGFSRVVKQQGRVELDADWNEQASIMLRTLRTMMVDLTGPHGGPVGQCAFRLLVQADAATPATFDKLDAASKALLADLQPGDFVLTSGHYYVDGLLCEVHEPFLFTRQALHRRHPLAPSTKEVHLIYLDVWEREVTPLEDAGIREVALGGADTAARMQVVWEIRSMAVERSQPGKEQNSTPADLAPPWPDHLEKLQPRQRGTLAVRAREPQSASETESPGTEGRYRGLENQLYRIEIQRAGKAGDGVPGATFKWSRDNGSVAFAVQRYEFDDDRTLRVGLTSLGRDDTAMLSIGDAVEFDDVPLRDHDVAGVLFQVSAIDSTNRIVTLQRPVPIAARSAPTTVASDAFHTLVLRRWDHAPGLARKSGVRFFENAVVIEEGRWLPLEDGVEVRFDASKATATSPYRSGDYWQVAARVATGDVVWPRSAGQPRALPPMGVEHHYAPLALVDVTATETQRLAPLSRRFGYHRLKDFARDVFARDGG